MNAIISIAEGLLITRFTSMTSINKDRSTTNGIKLKKTNTIG